jgi:PAS domain S-box-containing protein
VIYLTAHSDPATLARAKLTGPFGYILKPFEDRELAVQIELALHRHRADREVRQQREWLRVTLTSIGDAVIATDAAGRVTFVNPVAESLTGWKSEEATGQALQCVFRIINEQTGEPLMDPVVRALKEGRPVALANHAAVVTKDGRTVPIEDSAAPILDAAGQAIGAVLVFHDVTAKRWADGNQALLTNILQVLNRGGELHPLIAETLRLIRGTFGFDAAGLRLHQGEDYPYFEHNGFSDEFLHKENLLCARGGDGAIVRDAEGRAVLECTCGLVLTGRIDPTMPCFTEGGSFWTNVSRELLALPPQSDPRVNPRNCCIHTDYQSVGLFPVRAGQQIIGLLQLNDRREGRFTPELIAFCEILAQNIGFALQRITSEAALEIAKANAELANRAKDHFLAVLSHELRTPLTPVVMGVSMLQDRQELAPEVRDTLEMIRRNVEMEARLIDDLLDVTRITRGKLELNRSPVELCTVIHRAVEVCKPDIEARRLDFGVDLGPAAPYWVDADVARLQQVLWNLLKNAVKFTPHGGCVGIRCRPENERVIVEVNDSGIGIEPEAMSKVFNAFEQAERSITRQFGGLGLGLTISKALVELHGGTIEAHSEGRDKGATFRIRLPRSDFAGQPGQPASRAGSPRVVRPLRILLVEDHGVTAKMMKTVLVGEGHTVEMAGDVSTALEMADQHAFDLLLSDLGLPDGTGHDLMR